MRIFCDTSVVVASLVRAHPHHARAWPVVRRVLEGADRGHVAAHGLAETYAVLTTLPLSPRITPAAAHKLVVENVARHFRIVTLSAADYRALVTGAAENGVAGGSIYDALALRCAAKAHAERVYTFNLRDFERLATAEMAGRLAAP